MKKVLIILFLSLLFAACSNEPEKDYVKLIGTVNLRMTKIYDDGMKQGDFQVSKYLSDTKIELLSGGRVVETEKPKSDSLMEIFYLLTQVEKNKEYQIKISLNDSIFRLSKPFIVHDSDLKFYSADLFREEIGYTPGWLSSGYYYREFQQGKSGELLFIVEDSTFNETLYPNPVMSVFEFQYTLKKESIVSVDILDILLNPVKNLMDNKSLKAGTYSIHDQNILPDGLYLMRLNVDGEISYYGFVQGKKGVIYFGT